MRAKAGILLIMGLLLLVGTVAAADTSTNTTDKDWVIANGIDSSIISVNVSNTNGIKDGVATVKFTVNPLYGTMDPENVIADGSGLVKAFFMLIQRVGLR